MKRQIEVEQSLFVVRCVELGLVPLATPERAKPARLLRM